MSIMQTWVRIAKTVSDSLICQSYDNPTNGETYKWTPGFVHLFIFTSFFVFSQWFPSSSPSLLAVSSHILTDRSKLQPHSNSQNSSQLRSFSVPRNDPYQKLYPIIENPVLDPSYIHFSSQLHLRSFQVCLGCLIRCSLT